MLFLQGSSLPHAAWLTGAMGLKLCQDIGVHREKVRRSVSVERHFLMPLGVGIL